MLGSEASRFNVSRTELTIIILPPPPLRDPILVNDMGLCPVTFPGNLDLVLHTFFTPIPSYNPSPGPVNSSTKIYLKYTGRPFLSISTARLSHHPPLMHCGNLSVGSPLTGALCWHSALHTDRSRLDIQTSELSFLLINNHCFSGQWATAHSGLYPHPPTAQVGRTSETLL